jgi:glycerol-3-phosphate dehydrogenase
MRPPLERLDGSTFDVAIIGGGINGAAAAQHIAAQGHSVLLVEKGDFGSGSSSRSSRLLHCGLRYLAPGRSLWDFVRHPSRLATALRMAKQSMDARTDIVATSALRTRAMQFAFPIYRDGPYRAWQIDLAFLILRLVGPKTTPLDYRRISAAEVRQMPLARELRDIDKIHSVALYREYAFDWPERLCLDSLLDAERLGAVIRNYTEATLTRCNDAGIWEIGLEDKEDGARGSVNASMVINLTGIWTDEVNRKAAPDAGRRVIGTKGAHIVVKLKDEYAGYGVAMLNSKKEPFYCVPWHDLHFFGPTETIYDGNKDEICVTAEEQAWLLREANQMMPHLGLTSADVRMTWAGVRPLTYDEALPFGNRSRQVHDLTADGLPNVLAMTAGPVTTYRSAGQTLAREVAKRLKARNGRGRPDFRPMQPPANPNSPQLVAGNTAVRLSDLQHAVTHEHAIHLTDLLFARTGLGWRHRFSDEEIERAASVLATERGLSSEEKCGEIEAFRRSYELLFSARA